MELWLTSAEHWFWDVPRRLDLRRLLPGPEPGSTHADLDVAPDQPDAPMHLVARCHEPGWTYPTPGRPTWVYVWRLPTTETPLDDEGKVVVPSPRPTAWCEVAASRSEALRIGRR